MAASKVDWIALGVSILALGLSAATWYYSEFRGPDISVAVGRDVLITKTNSLGPRIGVICTFVNDGARQTIITDALVEIDNPHVTLPLAMVAETFGGFEEDDGTFKPLPTKYNLAEPIPVKGHDKAGSIFWFVPSNSFELTPGRHEFTLSVVSQDGTWKRHFHLDITSTNVSDIGKRPFSDHPISVVDQY